MMLSICMHPVVFPARAGMIPGEKSDKGYNGSIPRESGDDPLFKIIP